MITALVIAGTILGYGIVAGITHGLLRALLGEKEWDSPDVTLGAVFWPLAPFVWGIYKGSTLISNLTLGFFNDRTEKKLQRNQLRIEEIKNTRINLKHSQEELREAEEELERELRENGR